MMGQGLAFNDILLKKFKILRTGILLGNVRNREETLSDYIKCGEYLNSSYKEIDGKKILLPKEERDFTIQHVKTLPYVLQEVRKLYNDNEYKNYLIDLCKAKGSNLLMLEQMIIQNRI